MVVVVVVGASVVDVVVLVVGASVVVVVVDSGVVVVGSGVVDRVLVGSVVVEILSGLVNSVLAGVGLRVAVGVVVGCRPGLRSCPSTWTWEEGGNWIILGPKDIM